MTLPEVKVATVVMVEEIIDAGGRSNQGDHDEGNNIYCTRCDR